MNIVKIQQEIMAEIPEAVRKPMYLPRDTTTWLIHPNGAICYLVPTSYLYLDMKHLYKLDRVPFHEFDPVKWVECLPTDTYAGTGRDTVRIFRRAGKEVRLAKPLLKHFGKDARFYQEKELTAVAVVENGAVVAYVLPCRAPKENQ